MQTPNRKFVPPLPIYRYLMAVAISVKLTFLVILYPILQGTARLALLAVFVPLIVIQIVVLVSNIRRDIRRQRGL